MYHPFFQFVLPRLGQVALDALLYLNFLQLPPLQLVARWPVLYYGLPLVLMGVLAYISRDPLGLGIVFAGHLVTFYCIGTAIGLALRRIGGTPLTVWHIIWLGGITPWLLTGLIMWWGRRRALRLCTTKYSLTTRKNLPNGRLTIVQVSDVHPRACAAMDHTRIPELKAKIEACRPDLLVLTGDIFDEFTEPEELDAFCKLFGELDAPLGKYYVLGNHDLFHHWREPSFGRADLERGFAAAGVRIATSGVVERQGVVQRLDVGTSGLMVLAKSEIAYSVLKQAFRDRAVDKTYHTLVQGHPDPFQGTIEAPIGRHPGSDWKMAIVEGGRHSVTHYETLEAHRAATLLEVHLETGRTHQIRATMADLGCPLLGDGKYGRGDVNRRYGETRQALYAYKLTFDLPTDAGHLSYLRGQSFTVENVPFRDKYFG